MQYNDTYISLREKVSNFKQRTDCNSLLFFIKPDKHFHWILSLAFWQNNLSPNKSKIYKKEKYTFFIFPFVRIFLIFTAFGKMDENLNAIFYQKNFSSSYLFQSGGFCKHKLNFFKTKFFKNYYWTFRYSCRNVLFYQNKLFYIFKKCATYL